MLWEVARRWACDALKGAAANNAIGTRETPHLGRSSQGRRRWNAAPNWVWLRALSVAAPIRLTPIGGCRIEKRLRRSQIFIARDNRKAGSSVGATSSPELPSMPLLAEADPLLRYRYYKDLAPAEPVLAFLVRQLLLRLPHDPQEVALCYPD
jgi:hypothetical protein